MKLYIEIELDGKAFKQGGVEEVARLLADIGERLPFPLRPTFDLDLHDRNETWCGYARITPGKPRDGRK